MIDSSDSIQITSPLPQHFVTEGERVPGRIKMRPEDFVVEEMPLYEPCGEGEHIYLWVEKIGVAHSELMSCIRRHFEVPMRALGHAGMKDKQGVTTQMISVHRADDPTSIDIDHERIQIHWATRHRNKLRRGHLRGNRFSIRIRDVDPLKTPLVLRTLHQLERIGVPSYYGAQRFGYRCNNHLLGALLLHEDWTGLLQDLLGGTRTSFPEHQRERRELFDAGRYEEAAAHWSPADRSELLAAKALARGASPREAVLSVGRTTLNFFTSALMSAAFNRVLDQRINDGTVDQLFEGDLAWKHLNRAVFEVTEADIASGELPERLRRLEISPTGPHGGKKFRPAGGRIAEVERDALDATGVTEEELLASPFRPDGGRRPLRSPITNIDIEGGRDEHGPYIRTLFDLPRGIYATVAMREVLGA